MLLKLASVQAPITADLSRAQPDVGGPAVVTAGMAQAGRRGMRTSAMFGGVRAPTPGVCQKDVVSFSSVSLPGRPLSDGVNPLFNPGPRPHTGQPPPSLLAYVVVVTPADSWRSAHGGTPLASGCSLLGRVHPWRYNTYLSQAPTS
jgi:hypothetical protein